MATVRQLLHSACPHRLSHLSSPPPSSQANSTGRTVDFSGHRFPKLHKVSSLKVLTFKPKASSAEGIVPTDGEDGVSLGTMKLPPNTDIARFETLLFQWANSLCQGANLPLPVPLKVDRVQGGARLGFIEIGDGKTEVTVYIDCLVFPASKDSGPFFRAIRNGPLKDRVSPGEQRIMRSLLQALEKSVEIARI